MAGSTPKRLNHHLRQVAAIQARLGYVPQSVIDFIVSYHSISYGKMLGMEVDSLHNIDIAQINLNDELKRRGIVGKEVTNKG